MKTPKRYCLNNQQRMWMMDFATEIRRLQDDWPRRLRNSLIALSRLDPGWMAWVEREIPPHALSGTPHTPHGHPPTAFVPNAWGDAVRLIEARARALALKRYHFFSFEKIGHLIFADWPFQDDGSLTPG